MPSLTRSRWIPIACRESQTAASNQPCAQRLTQLPGQFVASEDDSFDPDVMATVTGDSPPPNAKDAKEDDSCDSPNPDKSTNIRSRFHWLLPADRLNSVDSTVASEDDSCDSPSSEKSSSIGSHCSAVVSGDTLSPAVQSALSTACLFPEDRHGSQEEQHSEAAVESMDVPFLELEESGYVLKDDIAVVSQGVIKSAEHMTTGAVRCVKCYSKSKMQTQEQDFLKQEVNLLFSLGKNSNIGEAIETFQDSQSFYLVQPFYRGGTLMNLKSRAELADVALTEAWWKSIVFQCLTGLAHMHAQHVVHCDIKEPNIMLRTEDLRNPEVVIIDLGIAQHETTTRTVIYGTPGYIPPEVWLSKNWIPQSDMFSLGVVVMQMLIGKTGIFTEGAQTYRHMEEMARCRTPPFELMPPHLPSLRLCAQKLLLKDFSARPNAGDLLLESWESTEVIDFQDKPAEGSKVSSDKQAGPPRQSLVGKRGPQRRKTFPAGLAPNPGMAMTMDTPRKSPRRQTVQIAALHTPRQHSPRTPPTILPTLVPGCVSVPLAHVGLGTGCLSLPVLPMGLGTGCLSLPVPCMGLGIVGTCLTPRLPCLAPMIA